VNGAPATLYDAVGGLPFFEELVDRFYEGVALDPVLVALYPEPDDLRPARRKLALFLAQYWGGPADYSRERGHPRLRMRHAPFAIGPLERDRWLHHMKAAVAAMDPPTAVRGPLEEYLEAAAAALRNREASTSAGPSAMG
jgi:hemoglobin